jgi:hypothetical protein
LGEFDKEQTERRDRAKDNDKPHFGQDPGIQFVDGVSQVVSFGDRGDRDGFVDSSDSCSIAGLTGYVEFGPERLH